MLLVSFAEYKEKRLLFASHIDAGPVNVTSPVSDPGSQRATISISTLEPMETRWSLRGILVSGFGRFSITNGEPWI